MWNPLIGKELRNILGAKSDKRVHRSVSPSKCSNIGTPKGEIPSPLFLVSVASKGLSPTVSLLFAILAMEFISVAAKGLTGVEGWRESNCVGWKDSEEVRGTTWRASMVRGHPPSPELRRAGGGIVPTQ